MRDLVFGVGELRQGRVETHAGSFNVSRKPAAEGHASGPPAALCAAAAPHRSRGDSALRAARLPSPACAG
jgi:hypothetical protein